MLCYLSRGYPSRVEWLLVREHTVDDFQELCRTRDQGGFLVLTTLDQAFKETLDNGIEADGCKARHE